MASKIKFILNPIAGSGRNRERMERILSEILAELPCEYDIQQTIGRGDALRTAHEAVQGGFDVVAAVGGDGTVNEVASALVNSNVCLGIIPMGSGNGLARGLGIPLQPKKACQILCAGKVRRIDVGKIQNRYFFATFGVGFGVVVAKRFNARSRRGPLPYFYIGFREFFNYQPKEVILKFDHRQITVKALLVAVANTNQFGNGAIIAPQAQPDDGLLDICIINDLNILQAVYHLPKLFTGYIDRTRYFEIYRSSNVEIIRPWPAPIQVDGETLDGDAKVRVSLIPRALKVMVFKDR